MRGKQKKTLLCPEAQGRAWSKLRKLKLLELIGSEKLRPTFIDLRHNQE